MSQPQAVDLLRQRCFGHYTVLDRLGSGGMGEVYRAKDETLGREVAIKVLRAAATEKRDRLERFEKEARAASALNHPNIVTIYEIGSVDGTRYIAMELVEGKTLRELIGGSPLVTRRALQLAAQAAEGLAEAHRAGIVHRDLKPENLMVTKDGRVKILDFGLAKLVMPDSSGSGSGETSTGSIDSPGTEPGVILGTVGYMSPEQASGHAIDFRSDQFSCGSILYEMATGKPAFRRATAVQTLSAIIEDEPEPIANLNASVPPPLRWIIERCMAKEPESRYASTQDLARDLRGVLDHLGEASGIPSGVLPVPPRRRRAMWSLAVVALAAVLLAIGAPRLQRLVTGAGSKASAGPPPVVAVLPLANLSGDASLDYLGVGLADVLLTRLARRSDVTVVSRSSGLGRQEAERNPRAIARELGASVVVSGGIHRSGRALRVTLELVLPDGSVAWGAEYPGSIDNVFALHGVLADGLSDGLQLASSQAERQRLAQGVTTSPEAFAAYAEGRALLERHDVQGSLERAVARFQAAVAADKGFALAHAGLGEARWLQYTESREPVYAAKAVEAILEALRLDPQQGRVHIALGEVYHGTGRSEPAIDELRRGLALEPNNDDAHRLLGTILGDLGRADEALAELGKAVELRPAYWRNHSELGFEYYRTGRFKDAVSAYRRLTQLQPDNARAQQMLGTVYQALGDDAHALQCYERAIALGATAATYSNLGTLHYAAGRFAEAAAAYQKGIALKPNDPVLRRNRGDALLRLHSGAEARAEYGRGAELATAQLKVNASDASLLSTLAACEAKLGAFAEAERHAEAAVAISPTDAEVLYNKAVVHALAGHRTQALAALGAALQLGVSPTMAEHDDDLAALRGLPEFRAALAHQTASLHGGGR